MLIDTNAVLDGNCKLGSNISIQTGAYITAFTTVENNVFIGPYMVPGAKLIRQTIKKGARTGANSTILPGVVLGEGAAVTKDVAPGNTVVGNQAKFAGRNLKYEQ